MLEQLVNFSPSVVPCRLRTQSQRVLQPVAWQTAPAELTAVSEAGTQKAGTSAKATAVRHAEAHVVVFVHGFRVGHL